MAVDCCCHPNCYECLTMYYGKPHYQVPAVPIEIDYTDCDMGYLDIFSGIDPCQHTVYRCDNAL